MPAYEIEFWVSSLGVPNSFYPLGRAQEATDADGNPAAGPIVFTHSPLIPGSRWWYKTRRVMYPDGNAAPVYSDFSAIREAVAPETGTTKGSNMDAIFGTETILGIGMQPFTDPHDKPRMAQWIVENPSGRVRALYGTYASRALRNTTARRMKTGAGRATFPFSFPIESTPNGTLAIALAMLFGAPTTTLVGGIAVTLSANAAMSATSLAVTALASGIPSGSVLDFSLPLTTMLTAANAAGDTTLTVAALPSAVPINTPVNCQGIYFRTTASATIGATSLIVTALPGRLDNGATVNYRQHRYVTTTAVANTGATTIAVAALGAALTSGQAANYGFKFHHLWKNNKAYNVGTFSQLVGDFVEVSPGAMVNQMEWAVDFEMDTFVTPTISGNALNQTRRYSLAQTGLDVALIDNLNSFSMIDALLTIDNVVSEDVKSATVSINRNSRAKGSLRRLRGVARQTPSITDITMTLDLYHTSDEFEAKYAGNATEPTAEYGGTCKIIPFPVTLEFAPCPIISGDQQYVWGINFSTATIETDDAPISGPDEIMESVQLVPNWDAALGTDATIYLVNDMSLSDIMTPSAPITPVPVNAVTSFTSA